MATRTKVYFSILTVGISIFIVLTTTQFFNITDMAYGQSNSLPFEIGDIPDSSQETNNTSVNSSNKTNYEENDQVLRCEMPPCPPGQACIQSCPEISLQ